MRVYTVCGMCGARCPLQVKVCNGNVACVEGNPHGTGTGICPRGAALPALEADTERPLEPLIRVGARGAGQWRAVSWDEAFDHIALQLQNLMSRYGGARSVIVSDRAGPAADMVQAFAQGLGTPNYTNHDATCTSNVQRACQSMFGFGRDSLVADVEKAELMVLQGRNLLESMSPAEVRGVLNAKARGMRLVVLDVRGTITASKADQCMLLRPGTDYALNLAVLHELIRRGFPNNSECFEGLEQLIEHVQEATPTWAEAQTGVSARAILALVDALVCHAPRVIWHPGWFTARYNDSFMVSRTAYMINALLGAVGAEGGLLPAVTPRAMGRKGLARLSGIYPPATEPRADGVEAFPWLDQRVGLVHGMVQAVATQQPYPLKAWLCFRHNLVESLPDPQAVCDALKHLELLVSVTTTWSATAWQADVVLPLSPPLSRSSAIGLRGGLRPMLFRRVQAVEPQGNSRADWQIMSGLAQRLGMNDLVFDSVEALWQRQLAGTGYSLDDFTATGLVYLADSAQRRPLEKLPTPSGRIQLCNPLWPHNGFAPYTAPATPPEGAFRLIVGRAAMHSHASSTNNPALSGLLPENVLWLAESAAAKLGICSGDMVEVASATGTVGRIRALVTSAIHPEAAFMLHGFGHVVPLERRAYQRGLADQACMSGGLARMDPNGGGVALQEHFIWVRPLPCKDQGGAP